MTARMWWRVRSAGLLLLVLLVTGALLPVDRSAAAAPRPDIVVIYMDVIDCKDDRDGGTSLVVWNADGGREHLIAVGPSVTGLEANSSSPPSGSAPTIDPAHRGLDSIGRRTTLGAVIMRGTVHFWNAEAATGGSPGQAGCPPAHHPRLRHKAVRVGDRNVWFVRANILIRASA